MLSSIAKASMLENAESPDPAVSSMSICFCGIVSLCSVNVVCPCGCCVCLYDVLISMTEEVVDIGTEGELWCVVGLLNLLECTILLSDSSAASCLMQLAGSIQLRVSPSDKGAAVSYVSASSLLTQMSMPMLMLLLILLMSM